MATLAQTVAGSTLRISATLPATYDAAGFAAVSYTAIAEVIDMGTLGKEYALVTHTPVGDRKTYKFKGSYNNGSLQIKMAKAHTDAGQLLALAAAGSDASYTFKITVQSGNDLYFTGKVMSFTTDIGTVDNILGSSVTIEIDSDIVETV